MRLSWASGRPPLRLTLSTASFAMSAPKTNSGETVAAYAVRRITELGLAVSPVPTKEFHWHGCPGDYSFSICDAIEDLKSAVWVGEGNELEARARAARQSTSTFPDSGDSQAGYAADGYARINGMVRRCGLILGRLSRVDTHFAPPNRGRCK